MLSQFWSSWFFSENFLLNYNLHREKCANPECMYGSGIFRVSTLMSPVPGWGDRKLLASGDPWPLRVHPLPPAADRSAGFSRPGFRPACLWVLCERARLSGSSSLWRHCCTTFARFFHAVDRGGSWCLPLVSEFRDMSVPRPVCSPVARWLLVSDLGTQCTPRSGSEGQRLCVCLVRVVGVERSSKMLLRCLPPPAVCERSRGQHLKSTLDLLHL